MGDPRHMSDGSGSGHWLSFQVADGFPWARLRRYERGLYRGRNRGERRVNIGGYQVCERAVEADATGQCACASRDGISGMSGVGETLPMTNSDRLQRSGGYPTE